MTSCHMMVTVKEFSPGTKVVFESSEGFLRPVMSISSAWSKSGNSSQRNRSKLTLGVYFNRRSCLFQYFFAPILKFLSMQHMKHGLFALHWLIPRELSNKA